MWVQITEAQYPMSGRTSEKKITISLHFTHLLNCFDPVSGRTFKGAWVGICSLLQTRALP